ncbi:LuxR C-terminal-related transcriptional regulator [Kitasatospora sp. NPDC049258]|uniref:ATP-binding protein n=1 Tax=Kitasatospora sp. NPDC049258 TaxID=3155394 RepID=UPI00343E4ABE
MTTVGDRLESGSLPAETTSLVGRRRELAEARKLLTATRVLTLTGPGGVGKTRLALRLAADVRRAFGGGVWLVDLAALKDVTLLPYTVADALGISSSPATRGQMDVIIDVLRGRHAMILLDNCEHVIDAVAAVAAALVRSLPDVKVLATSRQPLGVAGEHVLVVTPLPFPDPDTAPLPSTVVAEYPALALYAERARAATGAALAGDDWRDAARLCARLDGLPLAIELAAISARSLTPAQMLDRLGDWGGVLSRGSRAGPPRHRSLTTAVDWSYELCSAQERLLWARASVFAGSFTLEHLEAVCAGEVLAAEDILPAAAALVDKSVFTATQHGGQVRYRLLETLAKFGRDKLAAAGERDTVVRRHREHFLALARRMDDAWFGPDQLTWIEHTHAEHADLRAALAAHIAADDVDAAQTMTAALLNHWLAGHMTEGRLWASRTLALESADHHPLTRARTLYTQGLLAAVQADHAVVGPALDECRDLAEEAGDRVLEGMATTAMALAAYATANMPAAVRLAEQALAVPEYAASNERCLALVVLALTCDIQGDNEGGLRFSKELMDLCERSGEQSYRSWALLADARLRLHTGGVPTARVREILTLKRAFHEVAGISSALVLLARATVRVGDPARGAVLIGIYHRYRFRVGVEATAVIYQGDTFEEQCRQALGDAAYRAGYDRGFELSTEAALDFALGAADATEPTDEAEAEQSPLTPRERQVAAAVGQGLTNKEIAAELVISLRTAEGHVQRILTKLGFTSRTQLAAWSVRHDDQE